jgi:glutamyl-tRNA reductase
MLRGYKVITVTHRSTNVSDLGAYVVPEIDGCAYAHVREGMHHFNIDEVMYLQTCNRIMFIFYDSDPTDLPSAAEWFSFFHPEKDASFYERLSNSIIEYTNIEAIEHVFSVASSVDSLVVGEREILRQLRQAFSDSQKADLTGDSIRLLMRYAVESAKRIYDETRIGEKPVSVASLATHMLLDTGLNIDDPILLVGAGETNTIIAKLLKSKGFKKVDVFNRTYSKAQFLANTIGGDAHPLSNLPDYKKPWKALIVCTSAQEPIITPAVYQNLAASNTYHPKVMVDLAIPRNVDDEVAEAEEVTYIEVEGVRVKAEEHLNFRRAEVKKAEVIISAQAQEFHKVFQQRQIEKAMSELPGKIGEIKERAMTEVFKKQLAEMDDSSKALIMEMMNYMEKKCVGIPMKIARGVIQ